MRLGCGCAASEQGRQPLLRNRPQVSRSNFMHSNSNIIFSISIVSHGHRELVLALLDDLARLSRRDIEVILTWNLETENPALNEKEYPFHLTVLRNAKPKGFAENHNSAFPYCHGKNFVLMNPDIRISEDPFTVLLALLHHNPNAICAPIIVNSRLEVEDSARFFPSPGLLVKKGVAKLFGKKLSHKKIPSTPTGALRPEWIAGMFMVIPREIFSKLGGLSEKYHLYYEDVDFCARARMQGIEVLVATDARAIHEARRESHKNPRFFIWHLKSAATFFCSPAYLRMRLTKKANR
jgi:hypothetical protein